MASQRRFTSDKNRRASMLSAEEGHKICKNEQNSKTKRKKNLKASRVIGLGSTCEWVRDVFAQVEFVPMAIAAGRFANARPFHRTGW